MHISKHLLLLKQNVIAILSKDKQLFLKEFLQILTNYHTQNGGSLTNYWIEQCQQFKSSEIPVTKIGVKVELEQWTFYEPKINSMESRIAQSCQNLLTFWQLDDLCEMQGQFYYYFDIETKKIICESEFGNYKNDLPISGSEGVLNIATVSNLLNANILNRGNLSELY